MPPTCCTVAGTSSPPRSARRKRIPAPAGAGRSESATFLPECRPIPAQAMDRRSVRCAFIKVLDRKGSLLNTSNGGAAEVTCGVMLVNACPATVYMKERIVNPRPMSRIVAGQPQALPSNMWLLYHRASGGWRDHQADVERR